MKVIHSLSSVLTFGKYKGLTVGAVAKFNAAYLAWAVHHVEWFDLDPEARKIGQRSISADREARAGRQDAWAWGFGRAARLGADQERRRKIAIESNERRKAGLPLS